MEDQVGGAARARLPPRRRPQHAARELSELQHQRRTPLEITTHTARPDPTRPGPSAHRAPLSTIRRTRFLCSALRTLEFNPVAVDAMRLYGCTVLYSVLYTVFNMSYYEYTIEKLFATTLKLPFARFVKCSSSSFHFISCCLGVCVCIVLYCNAM